MSDSPAWRQYERQIAEHFASSAPGAKVATDQIIVGRLSGVPRKVEVVVHGMFPGYGEATMVVDCKLWNDRIDVGEVGQFIKQVEDIGAEFGALVTSVGFTTGAQNLANAHRGIRIMVQKFVPETGEWEPDFIRCDCDWYVDVFPTVDDEATEIGECEQCNTRWAVCSCSAQIDFGDGRPRDEWFDCDGECGRQWFIERGHPGEGRDDSVRYRDEPEGIERPLF